MLDSANLELPSLAGGPDDKPMAVVSVAASAPSDFEAAVIGHLIRSCATEPSDASAVHLYHAFAHAVRDRLVQRWLSTQRTYAEHDVKSVCYLSSEFLTGRSLGLCRMNLGLYQAAEALALRQGFDLTDVLERERDPPPCDRPKGVTSSSEMQRTPERALR